jgi:hypothetical protein
MFPCPKEKIIQETLFLSPNFDIGKIHGSNMFDLRLMNRPLNYVLDLFLNSYFSQLVLV